MSMSADVRYAARIQGVRELSLVGTADGVYWLERLDTWGLRPRLEDGRARVIVFSSALRWMGVAFREAGVVVVLEPQARTAFPDAVCLLQAYNTSRLFAFCERAFFATPYAHGAVVPALEDGARLEVADAEGPVISAARSAGLAGEPAADEPGLQFGPVALPPRRGGRPHFFIARIEGQTRTYPFDAARDTMALGPPRASTPVLADLHASGFTPAEWQVRLDAFHGKSKTFGDWAELG